MRVPKPDGRHRGGSWRKTGGHPEVAAAAAALVAELAATYDVRVEDGPRWGRDDVASSVRLVPAEGAPLLFVTYDDGRVEVRRGSWDERSFPIGFDWAEPWTPEQVVEHLRAFVADAIGGSFGESLTTSSRRVWVGRAAGHSTVWPESLARYAAMAPPGRYDWPAWPRISPRRTP